MNKSILSALVLFGLTAMFLPIPTLAQTGFNTMPGDTELLTGQNETQGQANWSDPISAKAGEWLKFRVYFHCSSPTIGQKAQNTQVSLSFPTISQTNVLVTGQVSATNVALASDQATVNANTAQKLVFDSVAKRYLGNQLMGDTTLNQGTGFVQANLGEVSCDNPGAYANIGYLVFRARLTSDPSPTPETNQALVVTLEAIPNYRETAPLIGVDLKATVSGTAQGTINYKFDCTPDSPGVYIFNGATENPKTVVDACSYQNPGVYTAKVRVERGSAAPMEAATQIVIGSGTISLAGQNLAVSKTVRNLSDNTNFIESVLADPGEVIEFGLAISNLGSSRLDNLMVKDTLPTNLTYYGGLKIDGAAIPGDILAGLNLGSLNPGQNKIIVFQARVKPAEDFAFGAIDLINTVLVYNNVLAKSDTATVRVVKGEVKGATLVPTGIFDNAYLAFLLSLGLTLLLTYLLLLKFYLSNNLANINLKTRLGKWLPKESEEKSQTRLTRMIAEIRQKEKI
jgi:uncharacterized repeat protein (TIGR01451 family)